MTTTTPTAPAPTPEWMNRLTESVSVLGAAAYELYGAQQQARHYAWMCDPVRVIPNPGTITIPGAEPARPHDEALWQLTDLYLGLAHHLKQLYENAALGYAHGTARAIQTVLLGKTPDRVELARDRSGRYRLPEDGLPDFGPSLSTRAGGPQLAELRDLVHAHEQDGDDPDADADLSTPYADAAYAYGEQAKNVLLYLLRYATDQHFAQAG